MELFILLKYVLEKLLWHLLISTSLNCLFCLKMFYRSYFGMFAFQNLEIVYFAYICYGEVILVTSHFSIFELFIFLKYVLEKLLWHLRISTSSNCFYFAEICFREFILASSHFNIFELFSLLCYVLEGVVWYLHISPSSNGWLCLNMF